jgi:hypothetical protein
VTTRSIGDPQWLRAGKRFLSAFALVVGLAIVVPAGAAQAATFTVTTTADSTDASTADGVCADSGNACSLRAAVQQANASPGADTISVPPGTYTLTLTGTDDTAAAGDMDVTGPLTVAGTSGTPSDAIIRAGTNTAHGIDRIFSVNPSNGPGFSFSLSAVTLRDGHAKAVAGSGQNFGGALDFHAGSDGAGSLSLSNSDIDTNTADDGSGGGLALFGGGTVSITGTSFEFNQAINPSGGFGMGGAIYAEMPTGTHHRTLTMSNDVLVTNSAQGSGGAIATVGSNPSATVTDSFSGVLFFNNTAGASTFLNTSVPSAAGSGGGAYLAASPATDALDQGDHFEGNVATGGNGGGLVVANPGGSSSVAHSTFSLNSAGLDGGGIWLGGGSSTISFNRIVGNQAATGTGLAKTDDPGAATLTSDWWGCNAGPLSAPCDLAAQTAGAGLGGGSLTTTNWLRLRASASPAAIDISGTSALTGDVLSTNLGGQVAAADLAFFEAQGTFSSPVDGTVSPPTVPFANGTATATFTRTSAGTGGAQFTLDRQTVPVSVGMLSSTDLQSAILESVDPVVAGSGGGVGNLTYTGLITNAGPSNVVSTHATGTLSLPAGVTASVDTSDGSVSYDPASGAIDWSVGSLAAGDVAQMTVTINVSAAAVDGSTISLSQHSSLGAGETDTNTSNDSRSISTTVTGAPQLSADPASLDFGAQQVGSQSRERGVLITDAGAAPLHFSKIELAGADADQFTLTFDGCSSQVIPPSVGGCQARVRFDPTSPGTKSALLRFTSDSATSPDEIPLSGVGAAPVFSATPTAVDFGDQRVGSPAPDRIVTITNTGLVPLTIANGALTISGPDAARFAVVATTCAGVSLAPSGGSCKVTVRFTPGAPGTATASLDVASSAATSPDSVPLSGTGIQAVVSSSPTSNDFGDQPKDSASDPQTFTITNSGDAPLDISVVSLAGSDPSEFVIDDDGCSGLTLAPASNDSCDIRVKFAPHTVGAKSASLQLVSDGAGGFTNFPLSGRSTEAEVSVAPASNNYGGQRVGTASVPQTFTVSNVGTGTLHITGVGLTGANPGDFNLISNGCSDVVEGGNCPIQVSFVPGSTGAKSASLELASAQPVVNQQVDVALTGTGTQSQLAVNPTSKNFGSIATGQASIAQAFIITNPGTAPLDLASVTLVGSQATEFAITANTCIGRIPRPLAPPPATASCEVDVRFQPASVGAKQASLRIQSDAPSSPDTVPLSGTGILPAPTVATGAASPILPVSATLTGLVNPNGVQTTYHFEWGSTTAYGNSTRATSAGAGTVAVAVSATLKNLKPAIYHFRLVATSNGGTTRGGDVTFSTKPPLPKASAQSTASAASTFSVQLVGAHRSSWTFHLRGGRPGSRFECRLGTRRFMPCSPNFTVTGLLPGRYRLVARAVGEDGRGDRRRPSYRFRVSGR